MGSRYRGISLSLDYSLWGQSSPQQLRSALLPRRGLGFCAGILSSYHLFHQQHLLSKGWYIKCSLQILKHNRRGKNKEAKVSSQLFLQVASRVQWDACLEQCVLLKKGAMWAAALFLPPEHAPPNWGPLTLLWSLSSNATTQSASLLDRTPPVSGSDGWLLTITYTVKSLTWIKTVWWLLLWGMKEAGSMKGKESSHSPPPAPQSFSL